MIENAIYVLQKRIREALEMLELQRKRGEIRSIDPKFLKVFQRSRCIWETNISMSRSKRNRTTSEQQR